MAKKRKKKSSKCPEPFNTLIDIAAGITMGAVADHMEKKYHYSKKGKINPYAVSAMGLASGRMKSTEDILKTGTFLGAMGSFDVEADDIPSYRHYTPEDPVFRQIRETKVNDNRYAWRLNCEDGSAYGVFPHEYETKAEYNEALRVAKADELSEPATGMYVGMTDVENTPSDEQYLFVRVSRLDNGANQFYLSENPDIKIGDTVTVPTEKGTSGAVVIACAWYSTSDAPQAPEDTMWIL